jgi:hypothetical protein
VNRDELAGRARALRAQGRSQLADENARLRRQLARALGELRSADRKSPVT